MSQVCEFNFKTCFYKIKVFKTFAEFVTKKWSMAYTPKTSTLVVVAVLMETVLLTI